MCGIAGTLSFDGAPASTRVLRRMSDTLIHRGPDGEGQYIDGPMGLAHRRLAVIDLSPTGRQPMASRLGRFVVVYNGELYNYQELRLQLESLGHKFRSESDTEVVVEALDEWGTDALPRFNGMFALAMWDRNRRELLIARDRFGVKPVYVRLNDDGLVFASEVKAILQVPGIAAKVDREALLEYFTFQNYFTSRTLFSGVELLEPGTWLRVTADGEATRHRWWDWNFEEVDEGRSADDYLQELEHLFDQAVARQMIADVPVSSYLSGGMDSGAVTMAAARHVDLLRTFTVGFDMSSASGLEIAFDERATAEHMSYLFNTEHYEMVLKAGDMERVMTRLTYHLEEPRVGQSYPNFYAAQLASRFGKVVLAGTGGDELFGGYPWRYYRAVVNLDFEEYVDKYYAFWQRLIPNASIKRVFAPIWPEVSHIWTRDLLRDVFRRRPQQLNRPEDYVNNSLYFEARTFLQSLLVVEDKLAMAHGLESRVPFLDNDLVDFAQRLPVRFKLGNLARVVRMNENDAGPKPETYFRKSNDGKLLFRQMMSKHLPPAISSGVKQGFSAPDASWFRGESINYVRDTLASPRAMIYDYLDQASVRELLDEHLDGRQNRRLYVWSLLAVENWLQMFVRNGGLP